jgi:hypothetical protein
MQEQIEEYRVLLKQLVSLKQKLVQVFEAKVEVSPLPPDFPDELRRVLKHVVIPGRSVTQVLQLWPTDIGIVPLFVWVGPRTGIVRLEEQNWLFHLHGSSQVSFSGLPSNLDMQVIEALEEGKMNTLVGSQGGGPNVEVVYLKGGRSDVVSAWSVSVFAQSIRSSVSALFQSDHELLLEDLVREGFLLPWSDPLEGGDRYFMLAAPVA